LPRFCVNNHCLPCLARLTRGSRERSQSDSGRRLCRADWSRHERGPQRIVAKANATLFMTAALVWEEIRSIKENRLVFKPSRGTRSLIPPQHQFFTGPDLFRPPSWTPKNLEIVGTFSIFSTYPHDSPRHCVLVVIFLWVY